MTDANALRAQLQLQDGSAAATLPVATALLPIWLAPRHRSITQHHHEEEEDVPEPKKVEAATDDLWAY
jgi:hypothetical protein